MNIPFLTPRITLHWLPPALATDIDAFWIASGIYPALTFEPAFRVTPPVLGRFWLVVEALARESAHSDEVASVIPTLDLLAAWIERTHGPGSFIKGLNSPSQPPLPIVRDADAIAYIDRAANADEYSRADANAWADRMWGKRKAKDEAMVAEVDDD